MSDYPKLAAAQGLMMDLLVARTRLGETLWPIDNGLRRTANILEAKGLIDIHHGHVEGTFRASLTDTAKKIYIEKATYLSPIERELHEKIAAITNLNYGSKHGEK